MTALHNAVATGADPEVFGCLRAVSSDLKDKGGMTAAQVGKTENLWISLTAED